MFVKCKINLYRYSAETYLDQLINEWDGDLILQMRTNCIKIFCILYINISILFRLFKRTLQQAIIKIMCLYGDSDCINIAKNYYSDWLIHNKTYFIIQMNKYILKSLSFLF